MKCPFKNNTHCFHKHNQINGDFKRRICGYKKYQNCELFLEWYELYKENNKSLPEVL